MTRPSILFDLDGVISDTASVHAKAWRIVLDDVLLQLGIADRPFRDGVDYELHVDGKMRLAGIEDFLSSRSVTLPYGELDDHSLQTMHGIGNIKNALFRDLIAEDGVRVFDDARRLIAKLRDAGFVLGIASSSKNAGLVLEKCELIHCFAAVMDGLVAERNGVRSKPSPQFYRHAAALLGRDPAACVVIEDAISGIVSAKQAGIKLVVGIARGPGVGALQANGADLVVGSLDEISIDAMQRVTAPC
jgi:HAD superfamily hydrolase (TIGR01509 family)